MEKPDNNIEQNNAILVEKINSELERLLGKNKFIPVEGLPKISQETKELLHGEKILIVDDSDFVLTDYIPGFMAATDGNASGFFSKGNDFFEISTEVQKINPSIIFMDYNFRGATFTGADVVMRIRNNFPGKIIGFSSDPNNNDEKFKNAGVDFCIYKDDHVEYALSELTKFLKNKTE